MNNISQQLYYYSNDVGYPKKTEGKLNKDCTIINGNLNHLIAEKHNYCSRHHIKSKR